MTVRRFSYASIRTLALRFIPHVEKISEKTRGKADFLIKNKYLCPKE